MLCKCHWIVLYTVHFTAFRLGGPFFPGHGVVPNPGINPGIPGLAFLNPEIPGLENGPGIAIPIRDVEV